MASEHNEIMSADIVNNGLLIAFKDGGYAIYSTELLLSFISRAVPITADEEEDLPL